MTDRAIRLTLLTAMVAITAALLWLAWWLKG
jgi:hypothetical protein